MNFKNESLTDFTVSANRQAMERELARVASEQGRRYSLVIDGKWVRASRTFSSINPSHPAEMVGLLQQGDRTHADRALETARRAFLPWSRVSVDKRADVLRRMAVGLRKRKYEFCAWMVMEVGKNWAEADADVAEAIDFLEYYAMLATHPAPVLTPVPGEKNQYRYLPLGPVVVIPPWNFPLAILVGMTTAALVTGNTVVLKPSSQSPVIAAKFVELAHEAGLPPEVLSLLTGEGASIGEYLVRDARTRMIAFTGSKAVGLHIQELAAQTSRGQKWIKRVIAEMGGKNAIIVDDSADLDSAAQGITASAFGYQGQKCSACSRLYVHASVYEGLIRRLLDRMETIRQGPAEVFGNFMGPVISAQAQKKIERYIAIGKKEGRILYEGPWLENGFYVPPVILDRLSHRSRLFHEEIFGPVLAVYKAKSFEESLGLANATDYGLTGAVYSQRRAHLDLACSGFHCGNLYLNRKCTGAIVGGHPFGGFDMSGTDSKAGGPDYLLLFTQAKCISEKVRQA